MATPVREARERRAYRSGSRQRVKSPFSAMQFYEDMGTTATPQQHEAWLERERKFKTAKKDAISGLEEYKGNISEKKSSIDKWFEKTGGSSDAWFNKEWEKYKKRPEMKTVRLLGKDGKVHGSYLIHKSLLEEKYFAPIRKKEKLWSNMFKNVKDDYKEGDYFKGIFREGPNNTLDIHNYAETYDESEDKFTRGSVIAPPHILKMDLEARQNAIRDKFEEDMRPKLEEAFKKQLPIINQARSALKDAQRDYDIKKKTVDTQIGFKGKTDEQIKQAYRDRLATMESLFGGLNIERKERRK